MSVFRSSVQVTRCDECKLIFDPVYGGVCARCRRLLCPLHLYGSVWRRILARVVPLSRPLCVRCRSAVA